MNLTPNSVINVDINWKPHAQHVENLINLEVNFA